MYITIVYLIVLQYFNCIMFELIKNVQHQVLVTFSFNNTFHDDFFSQSLYSMVVFF